MIQIILCPDIRRVCVRSDEIAIPSMMMREQTGSSGPPTTRIRITGDYIVELEGPAGSSMSQRGASCWVKVCDGSKRDCRPRRDAICT